MGKILGLDYGLVRIGVALSDEDQRYAFAGGTYDPGQIERQLQLFLRDEQIEKVVLGLPLDQHGQVGPAAQRVQEFGNTISASLHIPVLYEDERFTSVLAQRLMRQGGGSRESVDEHAARLILQTYLDKNCHG